ncbi:MAG: UDP-2,3-diacylglucosamine diphosphatase [Tannerella sp.]|jgi:UDP-2,3-diacylglucosamine hydrolase|nr:UDP-2,3-diacylglucosamine diphosphatase [Tannerella sp.]
MTQDLPTKNIYFASDAHLGNRYLDNPMAAEKKLVRWLDSIKNDAKAIYFLGDMFDYWYEYKYVVPRGHVRFLGKLAELSDMGIEIHLFIGNHDIWMFDYLPEEVGATIHQGPLTIDLSGKCFFLAHGDEVGKHKPTFRFLQAMFRNKICQFFYGGIHPRWTFGFAKRWSLSSRKSGIESQKQDTDENKAAYLISFAEEYLQTHPDIDFFIFGHRHVLFDKLLSNNTSRLLIAGDWMKLFSYIKWDGNQLIMNQFNG